MDSPGPNEAAGFARVGEGTTERAKGRDGVDSPGPSKTAGFARVGEGTTERAKGRDGVDSPGFEPDGETSCSSRVIQIHASARRTLGSSILAPS